MGPALRTWQHEWKVGKVDGAVNLGRGGGSCGMGLAASSSKQLLDGSSRGSMAWNA